MDIYGIPYSKTLAFIATTKKTIMEFFRKTRQSLLAKSKFSKYLIYAIGEIGLVVVGILIAVQLNNLNELRKQKLVEINILEGIRSDILKDTVDINLNILGYKNLAKADSAILNHLINNKKKSQALVLALDYSAHVDFLISLHNSHFYEAQLKGLSIISNETLREEITRLYEFEYEILSTIESSENLDHRNLLSNAFGQYFGYDSTGLFMSKSSYERLLGNKNAIFYFQRGQKMKKNLLEVHENTLEFALKITGSIDVELIRLKE